MAQQERARRTRAAIVEAAAFEFSRRGYAAASVNTILEGSRATKGAMYFHFSSKQELARAVLTTARDDYEAITGKVRSADLDPFERLHDIVMDLAMEFESNVVVQAEFRLVVEPEFSAGIGDGAGQLWGVSARALAQEAADAGLLKPEGTPERFSRILVACLAGQRYMSNLTDDKSDLTALFEESLDIVLAGMATQEWLDRFALRGWPGVGR